jgi:hypothetical protein
VLSCVGVRILRRLDLREFGCLPGLPRSEGVGHCIDQDVGIAVPSGLMAGRFQRGRYCEGATSVSGSRRTQMERVMSFLLVFGMAAVWFSCTVLLLFRVSTKERRAMRRASKASRMKAGRGRHLAH